MVTRPGDSQGSLPFDEAGSSAQSAQESSPDEVEGGPRRAGRPRVWASDAERKRAYRERLAADFAEPERLRRELRAERQTTTAKDREIARLKRDLARSEALVAAASSRQDQLERMITALEFKVEDWRSRARALSKRNDEERAEREAIDRRRSSSGDPKARLELPNLHTKGVPPRPPTRRQE